MRNKHILIFLFFCPFHPVQAQDSLLFRGQLSSWINLNGTTALPVWTGGRYIPQVKSSHTSASSLFDMEFSANIVGSAGIHPFDSVHAEGQIQPYRAWMRFSSHQFEIRLGLQKINFGSATMLRPLMWFDRMDPRDPLQLTNGVWGMLSRYYFLNNVNAWLWVLCGNHDPRGWDPVPTRKWTPEIGGRLQLPVPLGEVAVSYHHRTADNSTLNDMLQRYDRIPEHRIGFDAKWDLEAGVWIEGSWTRKSKNIGIFTHQEILDAGIDYTFSLGNGLYTAYEHLLVASDEKAFAFMNRTSFSLVTFSYPVGLFDKLSLIAFYNWTGRKLYNFLSWQKQYDNITLYLMAYWNPEQYQLPALTLSQDLFSGKGIQLMFVLNH